MTGLLFFMLVPHKSMSVEHSGQQAPGHKTIKLKKSSYKPVRESANPHMQRMLEQRIAALNLTRAIKDKRLAIALVDVTDPSSPSMAQVNGDEMMYAASLPKIAILLAAFERIQQGKLPLDDELRSTMTKMIRHSSNQAATEMIRKVGGDYINQVLESPKYKLYDPQYNGGLWVGKEYAGGSAFHRDPLHHLSHGATAMQVARYYYLLETGQLVSPKYSNEMKTILSKPGISHKFVKGLQEEHANVEMYRKSGTWRQWHADSALIEHDGRTYIAVALAKDAHGGEWMKKLIREMDDIILAMHRSDEGFAVAHAGASQASDVRPQSSSAKRLM